MHRTIRCFGVIVFLLSLTGSFAAQPAQPGAPQEKDTRVYGQRIHYVEAGTAGPVVILLHGLGGSTAHWRATLPALGAFHVFVPDQIGFGKSDKPLINYRIATLVDFLEGFCRQLDIPKATLVGNSLGGWVAAAFAVDHPERVDRLVLVDSAGYSRARVDLPPLTREDLRPLNPSTLAEYRVLLRAVYGKSHESQLTDDLVRTLFAEKLSHGDGFTINQFIEAVLQNRDVLDGRLGEIKAPTLVVWGGEDALIPPSVANVFTADIHGAQKIVLDTCGHAPQLQCALEFNKTLLGFLNVRSATVPNR